MPRPRLLTSVKRSELRKAFDQDLPEVPPHWHAVCDCLPTVAYIRVSKIGKRTNIKSPTIQLNEIVANAKARNLRIVKIVFDLNVSGQNFDREALNEVLSDLQAGQYRHVSLWAWSRWGRNLLGSLTMIAKVEDLGGYVESATEPFDASTVWGEFNRDQALLQAQFQGKMIGKTWKSVHSTRRENQLPHSGRKKFGYDYDTSDERDRHYVLNEAEAEALEACYRAYLSGRSMRKLAADLNEAGFRTEFGNRFTTASVGKMMDTGFAAGLLRSRSEEQKRLMKRKPANTLASYDQWDPGKQAQIIDMTTWQAYKKKRLAAAGNPPRLNAPAHELSGLVFCGVCARRLQTKYTGTNRHHRWHCAFQSNLHPEQSVSIANDEALDEVKKWFGELARPEYAEEEARRLVEREARIAPQKSAIEVRLAELEAQASNLMTGLRYAGTNETAAQRVMAELNEVEEERVTLAEQLAAFQAPKPKHNWRAFGDILTRWDEFPKEVHNTALAQALGMVVVAPRERPRARVERSLVTVVPLDEMSEWSDWLSARRQRSA